MAWTQTDVDAKKAEIATMVKSVAYGDKNVTNFDIDQQLKLLAVMEAEVAAGSGATSVGRCTIAGFSRD